MKNTYSNQLHELIFQLEKHLNEQGSLLSETVSNKPIIWHIDHSLRVIIGIANTLNKSNPKEYTWKFNWLRSIVFFRGKIPRGKGRAPKVVLPNDVIKNEEVVERIKEANKMVDTIANLNKHCYFKHPLFGNLSLAKSHYFMIIHTKHHLSIINDIIICKA